MRDERRASLAKEGANTTREQSRFGLIGRVTKYHPPTLKKKGKELEHTADVRVMMGEKSQTLYNVPCFVYGSSKFDYGLYKNDRVYVAFLNGDMQYPVIVGYYREPSFSDRFFNTIRYGVSAVLEEIL